MEAEADEYLDAFMNGFEFVLLAIRGRLAEERLSAAERARLDAFLEDYQHIVRAYRERRSAPPSDSPLAASRPFHAEASAASAN